MSLAPGSRLGPYIVEAAIGAGGMGEVYRAIDTHLKRPVAVKVLPVDLADDPDRLARFQREAEALAALNHPHIAQIYGLEHSGGSAALVMELVEGPTLADLLRHGPIPGDEALPLARQIAEAVEAAHDRGIVHRDLKPSNIKVRPDGAVKVLDFGLAKAAPGHPGEGPGSGREPLSQSPTLATPAATLQGVLLGTAAYMSPEQAKGKPVDRRTDVWAFGCVLFEMLSGHRAFDGEDVSDVLANVLKVSPDWAALPASTPSAVHRLLRRCLEKDWARRLPDIGVARLDIDEALHGGESTGDARWTDNRARRGMRRATLLGLGGSTLFVLLLALWAPWRSSPAQPAVRVTMALGGNAAIDASVPRLSVGSRDRPGPSGRSLALSPDGSILAFVGERASRSVLYVRSLDQLEATPLESTAGARDPFFSPDGGWIGFFTDDQLKKVRVDGGAAVALCDAPNGAGGAWGEDDRIVFAARERPGPARLNRVSAAGGIPEPLAIDDDESRTQRWPQVLPRSGAVLFTALGAGGSARASINSFEDASVEVLPQPGSAPRVVVSGAYHGRYLASGHLVYVRGGTLFAVRFDLSRLEVRGEPVPIVRDLVALPNSGGGAQFDVSSSGTLVYLARPPESDDAPIVWINQQGEGDPIRSTPSNWYNPRFSPDGGRLALDIVDGMQADIWLYDWARDALTRLTSDPSDDIFPVWTPDGRRLTFASTRGDQKTLNLYWQRADGGGPAERLTESNSPQLPGTWDPTGRHLVFQENAPLTGLDIKVLHMEGDEASGPKPGAIDVFLSTPFVESAPAFSPDGRWIAYHSNEAGATIDVYVRPFPGPGGKWRISTAGGSSPVWSPVGSALFYLGVDDRIMVVPYTVEGESFTAGRPSVWSEEPIRRRPRQRSYEIFPTGDRWAVAGAPAVERAEAVDQVVLVLNFFDELRRIAGP